MLAVGFGCAIPAGVLASGNDSAAGSIAETAARTDRYLGAMTFDDGTRRGVVEAASKVRSFGPFEPDVLISLHGVQPNVAYRVIGSSLACSQPSTAIAELFSVDLPATATDDRFFKDRVTGTGSVKRMKSARIFEGGIQTGCKRARVYSLSRFTS